GVAHVCNQYQLPFVVVRAISDVADKEASMSFEEFLPVAAQQSSVIVAAMLKQLNTY
ncbi:MAG: 5'-methylthioadenosine/S-adenosylhomocysteine nucleosidase, partial [Plesiomonas sp.]|nr:5'-methylthioadenosine/S-adenosylhomocysteine nucleosidase [Plesiomonas shigelloides]